ncbi:hypothetical protein [Variovorax sp. Root473]|nr:hypothetical protein [Variovorax sp. Root473]
MLCALAIANCRSLRRLAPVVLEKRFVKTRIANLDLSEIPRWEWPTR